MSPRRFVLVLALAGPGLSWSGPVLASRVKLSFDDCPREGRGGDAALNWLKNRPRAAASAEAVTLDEILRMEEPEDEDLRPTRQVAEENEHVAVMAHLIHASRSRPEACNCNRKRIDHKDLHLNLVADRNDGKGESVVVEITPRFSPDGWTLEKLKKLAQRKAFVRVQGWQLYDSMHTGQLGWRGTSWEIHPVTRFEVCTGSKAGCENGQGWRRLEAWTPPQ